MQSPAFLTNTLSMFVGGGKERGNGVSDMPENRKVFCGPGMGDVEINEKGRIIITESQLAKLHEYEKKKRLDIAEVEKMSDGRFLLVPRNK
jgi:hypothetical protein